MATSKTINLSDLQVNTENYRFEPVASQKEAIDMMVEDQSEKLLKIAEHILENGLNPIDRIQTVVSSHAKTKFNVLEGNRRTVSLKLLSNPDLIDGAKFVLLKKKFRKLHEDNKDNLITKIECIVYDNAGEADKWIKLKHAGQLEGIGTVTWTPQQIDRFEEKVEGKSSLVLQTIKLLEKSPETPADIQSKLNNFKTSNLERLVSDPNVRNFLGVEVNNGILQSETEPKEVIKGLVRIVRDLMDPSFKVNKIYTKEDREDYIQNIPKAQQPNTALKSAKPWQLAGPSHPMASAATIAKPKPNPKDRDVLIPKSCVLAIKYPKVNSMYHELQKLSVDKFTNTAAIAFRSFVEFSMDCYIESNTITTTKDGKGPVDKHSSFIKKIIEVANHLETNKFADSHLCKGIRSAASNKNDLLGIETLHAYVHNAKFSAIPKNIIITWDNIQPFMEKVWGNIT
ncbi:MAG: hypothetical protein JWQ09_276 [Segetibacter sp.]|nr:hypothetical protein [Segetibacter sp.]